MADPPSNFYEHRLIREIESLEARIVLLRQEQEALKRQLIKARWETHALRDVNRKNSAPRVLVEERILATLRREGKPIHNSRLFSDARQVNFELMPSTFRTYLHRMKEKGLIISRKRGSWELPPPV